MSNMKSYLSIMKVVANYQKFMRNKKQQDPETVLRSLARMTTVVGKMLEGVSAKYLLPTKPAAWITWIGRFFWGLVEVAVPRSIWNLIAHYWIRLLYLFEIVLIVSGTIINYPSIRNFGWVTLGATLLAHFIIKIFERLIRGKWKQAGLMVLFALVAGIITFGGLGFLELQHLLDDLNKLFPWLEPVMTFLQGQFSRLGR